MSIRTWKKSLVVTAAILVAAGCSAGGGGEAKDDGTEPLKITFLAVGLKNTYVAATVKAAKAEAKARNVDLTVLDGQFDATLQSQQLRTAVTQKPDGIVVWPMDSKAIIPAAAVAQAAGIPLTFADADIDRSGEKYRLAYSGPDNYTQGVNQYRLMKAGLTEKGVTGTPTVAMILSFAGSEANVQRVKGFNDEDAKSDSAVKIVSTTYGDSDVTKSRAAASQILTKHAADLDVIYAQDDNVAVGASQAVKEAGLSDKIIIVGNGLQKSAAEAIAAGTMYGTLNQSPSEDGSLAISTIYSILKDEPYEKVNFMDQPMITKANVDEHKAEW